MKNPYADNECKILSKHFSADLCRNANYIVNIIEKLSGSGRDDNGIPIPGVTVERQNREKIDAHPSDCLSLWSK